MISHWLAADLIETAGMSHSGGRRWHPAQRYFRMRLSWPRIYAEGRGFEKKEGTDRTHDRPLHPRHLA
jgi:hypothetical protein